MSAAKSGRVAGGSQFRCSWNIQLMGWSDYEKDRKEKWAGNQRKAGTVMFDLGTFLVRLRAYPSHLHRFLPPCPPERIETVEKDLGKLPTTLKEMLGRFNGAELFCSAGPSVTVFGISTIPPLPPLEWAPEWCIDAFTPKWRAAGSNRQGDWAIAMTNYGGLILFDGDGTIKEWDTGQSTWLVKNLPFDEWIKKEIREGEVMIAETG